MAPLTDGPNPGFRPAPGKFTHNTLVPERKSRVNLAVRRSLEPLQPFLEYRKVELRQLE
jgi:hypothetical protein